MCVAPASRRRDGSVEPAACPGSAGELDVLAPDEPVRGMPSASGGAGVALTRARRPDHRRRGHRVRRSVAARVAVARAGRRRGRSLAGDEQLLGREARDHVAAVPRDHDLLLDPRRRAAVGRGAVGLEREHHPLLELDRAVERVHARDHRRLVQADADAVPELQAEARLLVREAELLRGRPDRGDLVRRRARPDELDRRVEPLAALLVGVELRLR